ncbi:trans-aconitate 2-methyltransferase [Streptomyces sparsogenes]|uniref:trans-aconitate 2-methyltransferase n=1 Tax=Streptomyces sparsogenes TaxID=67365 RepID=UPI0034085527
MHSSPTWDPGQYLRHAGHRTRPFLDLLARVPGLPTAPGRPPRIADLGCGAGNVTVRLFDRWPDAHVTGLDNSAEMLEAARAHTAPEGGGRLDFRLADAAHWAPDEPFDLIVSNALLQWVPGHTASFPAWIAALRPGGTFAFQVPGNFTAPSHTLLAELSTSPRWRDRLPTPRAHSTPVLDPAAYLEHLAALGCEVDAWETTYIQMLTGPDPVLDWVKGTALRPVLTALEDDPTARDTFLAEYAALLRGAYPPGPHGTAFPFRRVFVVARAAG